MDILVAAIFNTMHNVMKRGYLMELTASIKHAALILVIMSLYLFSTQAGDTYSRITIYLTSGFHLLLGYGFRLLWKPVIRKINKGKSKDVMILVAEENSVPKIIEKASELDGFDYAGIILSDRDGTGERINGIKVVSSIEKAADYICRDRVDEVFVYPEHLSDLKMVSYEAIEGFIEDSYGTQAGQYEKPDDQSPVARLIEQCREMALPVHIRLPISSVGGKSFMEKVGGYNVLTMTVNYTSPFQLLIKRIFDILGGLVGSVFALVLIAIIGPKIKQESPGPILFKQTRIGLNGKRFIVYKISDTEKHLKHALSGNNTGRTGTIQPFKQLCFC